MEPPRPKVGIGILLIKGNSILLGRRLYSHGKGEYSLPGGHLELQESFQDCVLRELTEEAGPDIKVKGIRFLCVTNLRKYHPKHYVDIGMLAEWVSGDSRVMEPEKLESWQWYDLDNLPKPLFGCIENYIESYKTDRSYFEE
jgi:8-oxo-dGTP diphosphatase